MTRWMRRINVLLIFALLAGTLSACGKPTEKPPAPGGSQTVSSSGVKDTIVVSTSAEPTSLDPQYGEDTTTQRVVMQISDTLINVDQDMNYVEGLAEKWEISEDGLTYTFHLRPGVKAHNGDTLTSEDVAYTVERGKASTLVAKAFAAIDQVECPDENTVIFHLSYASPIQLAYLSSPSTGIVNKRACEEMGNETFGRAPVAYGPYQVVSWDSGDKVTLKAFEDYWAGKPAIENVVFKVYTDSNTAVIALQSGQIDVVLDVSTSDMSSLEADNNISVYTGDSLIAYHLHLNCTKPPLDNEKVRQALNHAVDTQAIIDACFEGVGATKMGSFIPKLSLSQDPGDGSYEYSVDKAKQLLQEAGYADGFSCNILVTSGEQEKIAQVLKAYLQQVNIDLTIEVYEWSTLLSMVESGGYDMTILRIVAMVPDPDLSLYTRFESSQVYNFSKFSDQKLDTMLEDARVCPDPSQRTQMYLDINNYLWEKAPTVPLCFTTVINAANAGLQGYHTDPRGFIKVCELSW